MYTSMCTYRYGALLWCALGRDMGFVFRAPLQSPHIHKYIYTYIHTYIYIHIFFCAPLLVATCVVIWLAALSKAWVSNETLHLQVFCTFLRVCVPPTKCMRVRVRERVCMRDIGAWGEVGGWGRDPKKCTGRDWGMGSSTI